MPNVAIPEPHSEKKDYNERSAIHYISSLRAVGLTPVFIPSQTPPDQVARLVSEAHAILLPGSSADVAPQKYGAVQEPECNPADPLRDNLDEMLLQDAHNLHKPIFAICYGMQTLNVWRTGTLIQHLSQIPIDHEAGARILQAHSIEIEPGSRLHQLAGACDVPVNSSHHQSVAVPGAGLRIVAKSPKDGVIEALEGTAEDHWLVAVQWHPERTFESEPLSRRLFEDFASAAQAWKPRTITESVYSGSR